MTHCGYCPHRACASKSRRHCEFLPDDKDAIQLITITLDINYEKRIYFTVIISVDSLIKSIATTELNCHYLADISQGIFTKYIFIYILYLLNKLPIATRWLLIVIDFLRVKEK